MFGLIPAQPLNPGLVFTFKNEVCTLFFAELLFLLMPTFCDYEIVSVHVYILKRALFFLCVERVDGDYHRGKYTIEIYLSELVHSFIYLHW